MLFGAVHQNKACCRHTALFRPQPTKKPAPKLKFEIIADCHAINNQINDEWLIRDQGSIARQLGYTPKAPAQHLIDQSGGIDKCQHGIHPCLRPTGSLFRRWQ